MEEVAVSFSNRVRSADLPVVNVADCLQRFVSSVDRQQGEIAMAAQQVLSPQLTQQFESLRDILHRSLSLAAKCSDTEASRILSDRLTHLQSAALLVIVGEVNSGKSSFINALLGDDVCEVAPDPCTAVIQELIYGDERTRTSLGDHWERLRLPKEVLRQVSIVDTLAADVIPC